ncbi:MAG: hypothetical protein GY843_11320 [Neptuniibacter sp.]|nr:hypothetical protein [Neptuniibacter sp.]
MPLKLVRKITSQIPSGILIQFHNNGEPLMYPNLGTALAYFNQNIRCLNTNGKLLLEKADEIIGNLDTLTVSVIPNDPEGDEQYDIVKSFVKRKKSRRPYMVYRLLGGVERSDRWEELEGTVARRILHDPMGSRNYEKTVTIPEHGICLDLLSHLAIDRWGNVAHCVRFDPEGEGRLGNIKSKSLASIWKSVKRREIIERHIQGRRDEVPLCSGCDYWGIPRG